EGEILQRALAALVADRAVERMVDEDELERRVLGDARHLGGAGGLDDHSVLRRQRAGGLGLRRRSFDLDEPGALWHLHRALVDRDGNELARAHTAPLCSGLTRTNRQKGPVFRNKGAPRA